MLASGTSLVVAIFLKSRGLNQGQRHLKYSILRESLPIEEETLAFHLTN